MQTRTIRGVSKRCSMPAIDEPPWKEEGRTARGAGNKEGDTAGGRADGILWRQGRVKSKSGDGPKWRRDNRLYFVQTSDRFRRMNHKEHEEHKGEKERKE